jgi:hypothetical protein
LRLMCAVVPHAALSTSQPLALKCATIDALASAVHDQATTRRHDQE